MSELRAYDISKTFPGGHRALDGVSIAARPGRVLTLLGPSGCGKTTLLRIVAGLEEPDTGRLELDGRSLLGVPPGARDVGFVFQNYALYPHLTVEGNLGLALEARGMPRPERMQRVRETAALLGIGGLLHRKPAQLSGGQQQRVALGRALVRRPRLHLLDEPLSNLDAQLRETMRAELRLLFRRMEATVIYVTHDQAEALSLSDEVAVMRDGRVLQCAPPLEVYARPASLFVATFVGSPRMTVWRGERDGDTLRTEGPALPWPAGLETGREVFAGIRPEDVEVSAGTLPGGFEAEVTLAEPMGARTLLTLRAGDAPARAMVEPGAWAGRVSVRWLPERIHWFDAGTEQRLTPGPPGTGG
jgi:ABC-type sugar transport system ATPase subunit